MGADWLAYFFDLVTLQAIVSAQAESTICFHLGDELLQGLRRRVEVLGVPLLELAQDGGLIVGRAGRRILPPELVDDQHVLAGPLRQPGQVLLEVWMAVVELLQQDFRCQLLCHSS